MGEPVVLGNLAVAAYTIIGVVLYALVQSLELTLGLIMLGILLAFNSMRSLARRLPTGIFVVDFDAESIYLGIRSGPYADQFCC
jgi:hypothetical protein